MKLAYFLLFFVLALDVFAQQSKLPLFDAHLHYNVEARQLYPLQKAFELFNKNGVMGILANSRPNDGTRDLYESKQDKVWVVPFIRPYVVRPDRYTWFADPKIYGLIELEFQRGYYQGIGEFHLFGKDAKSPWVKKTVDFAVKNNLYLHAHSDEEALEILFSHHKEAKIIWAHTGFTTQPDMIEKYIQRYPHLWCELSYRTEVAEKGKLKPEWRALFIKYPERFLIGSDTWVTERWGEYSEIINEYRAWLAELPPHVAKKIAFQNAEKLFKKK